MLTAADRNKVMVSIDPPTIADAVRSLTADAAWSAIGNDVTFISGTNLPTQAQLDAELADLLTEWAESAYIRNRAVAFSAKSYGEQLDMMYWDQVNSTTLWQDWRAGIKAAYPKP